VAEVDGAGEGVAAPGVIGVVAGAGMAFGVFTASGAGMLAPGVFVEGLGMAFGIAPLLVAALGMVPGVVAEVFTPALVAGMGVAWLEVEF